MKLFLTSFALLLAHTTSVSYTNLTKASDFEVHEYGSRISKDIRNIGRSYAANLIKKETLTDYAKVVDQLMGNTTAEEVQDYAKEYAGHILAVGLGFILFLFLLIGFCCSWTCCCFGNKSQATHNTAAMWRMIWGTIIFILLAANVAGVLILIVSGQELMTLQAATTSTIEGVGDDVVQYLNDTDAQFETLKSDEFPRFIQQLSPLVNNSVDNCVANITGDVPLSTAKDTIVTGLNNLDGSVAEVNTTVNNLDTSIDDIADNINTINTYLSVCKAAIEACDAGETGSPCSDQIDATEFDATFSVADLQQSQIEDLKTKLDEISTFDGKTIGEWATFVADQWNNLDATTKEQAASADVEYQDTLKLAREEFETIITNDVQMALKNASSDVQTYTDDVSTTIDAVMQYFKDVMMFKNSTQETFDNVPDSIETYGTEPYKYVLFGVFLFVLLLAVLLLLTILIGLVTTILGCCRVNDDLAPNERKSGTCGSLMMCTSYCSVMLCAIATLVAAILVTVVMLDENLCKQYSDDKLISVLSDGYTLESTGLEVNLTKTMNETLNIEGGLQVTFEEVMKSCENSATLISAFKFTKSTSVSGQSIASIQETIQDEVDKFNASSIVDGLSLDFSHVNTSDLETNKDALSGTFDFDSVKNTIANTSLTGLGNLTDVKSSIDSLISTIGNAKATEYNLTGCATGLDFIQTASSNIETAKPTVLSQITYMEGNASTAEGFITNVIDGVNTFTGILTDQFIKDILITQIDLALAGATNDINEFVDYLFLQLQTTLVNCQPLSALYKTVFNYSCDSILIHITLIYCSLSLIGISLLFYMCVSRCLARYFINYPELHPNDANKEWKPYNGAHFENYAQTKL